MRTLILITLFTLLPVFADEAVSNQEEAVDARAFFTRITGQYKVDLAGGVKPHEGSDAGLVMIDGTDGVMSFSYCQSAGLCDPNDQYFPLGSVMITKTTFSDSIASYDLKVKENDAITRFTWDENGSSIHLKNYQYKKADGSLITLEHVFHKKEAAEETNP